MTGSLNVSGSATIIGRVTATDLTGSLFGTASQAASASFASTASNVLGGITSYVPLWNSATTLGNSVIFQSSSNIGIGVSPQSGFKLDVGGQSVLRGDVYSSGTIIGFGSNTNYRIGETGNSYLAAATGNVGIGHRSPSALLHVSGSGNGSLMQISSTVSSSVFFVSGSGNVGIGTITPEFKLDVSGSGQARIGAAELGNWPSVTNYAFFGHERLDQTAAGNYALLQDSGGSTYVNSATGRTLHLRINNNTRATVEDIKTTISGSAQITGSLGVTGSITSTGNITTAGTLTAQTLVVQTITSSITYSSGSNIFGNSTANTQTMTGSLNVSGSASIIGGVGIGATSLTGYTLNVGKNLTGATTVYGIAQGGTVQSDVTLSANGILNNLVTAAASFTLTNYRHFYINQTALGVGSSVTNQYGVYVENNVIGATYNYGFFGRIPSGTNRWNLYMEGTAANYMAGSLGIGSGKTSPTATLDVSGSTLITGSLGVTGPITGSSILSTGTITAQTLVVTTVSSSVVFSSGSNIFGNSTANTQTMTGSLNVSGSATIVGRVTATDLTGSLFGTASWATNFITGSVTSASFAFTASSAISSSLAQTSSFSLRGSGAFTGSFSGSVTASLFGTASQATSASYAFTASSAISSSYALTASFALNGGGGASFPYTGSAQITGSLGVTGSFSVRGNQGSSVFSSNADTLLITGSLIITGSGAITGSLSVSSGITGSLFGTASQAITASYALTASFVASIAGLSTSQIATGSVTASVGQSSASFQLVSGSTSLLFVSNSRVIGINNPTPSLLSGGTGLAISGSSYTQLQIKSSISAAGIEFLPSSGDTWEIQATNAAVTPNSFLIYNRSDDAYRFLIDGNGNVAIGGTRPSASLDVSGSFRYTNGLSGTGSVNISGSLTVTGSITTNGTITAQTLVVQTITSSITYSSGSNIFGNALTNTQTMTGSVNITGSLTLRGNQTVFGVLTVQSASFDYGQNTNVVTGSFQVIASEATSSFRCAFFDYVMFSGSVVRAGTVTSTWSGGAVEFNESYTNDLSGSTAGVILQTALSGGNIQLQATASSQAWTIRSLIRLL
jgi:hypothetical protein